MQSNSNSSKSIRPSANARRHESQDQNKEKGQSQSQPTSQRMRMNVPSPRLFTQMFSSPHASFNGDQMGMQRSGATPFTPSFHPQFLQGLQWAMQLMQQQTSANTQPNPTSAPPQTSAPKKDRNRQSRKRRRERNERKDSRDVIDLSPSPKRRKTRPTQVTPEPRPCTPPTLPGRRLAVETGVGRILAHPELSEKMLRLTDLGDTMNEADLLQEFGRKKIGVVSAQHDDTKIIIHFKKKDVMMNPLLCEEVDEARKCVDWAQELIDMLPVGDDMLVGALQLDVVDPGRKDRSGWSVFPHRMNENKNNRGKARNALMVADTPLNFDYMQNRELKSKNNPIVSCTYRPGSAVWVNEDFVATGCFGYSCREETKPRGPFTIMTIFFTPR